MNSNGDQPIGQLIRSARQQLQMSQYDLANKLAAVSGRTTVGRDRVSRWERGRQVPRNEWRQWLSVVLDVPKQRLDVSAAAARRRSQLGHAAVTANAPVNPTTSRRLQGTPALLPVFRSRIQAGILAATLLNPNRAFSLTELADQAGGSLASVSKEAHLLETAGLLTTRSEGTIRLIRAVTDKPMIAPLTELIRLTYGVPQVIGEEFGRVRGVDRIAVTGTWAERFAGLPGPEPDSIQLCLMLTDNDPPDHDELVAAAQRAGHRLKHGVTFRIASTGHQAAGGGRSATPQQRDGRPIVEVAVVTTSSDQATTVNHWPDGSEVITQMLEDGQLELVTGTDANSTPFFGLTTQHLDSAEKIATVSPGSALLLICRAARLIGFGLLAQQGLRPASGVGETVVGQTVAAQFGPQFSQIELLRQRWLELSTPISRDNRATLREVQDYLPTVRGLLASARELVPQLQLFD